MLKLFTIFAVLCIATQITVSQPVGQTLASFHKELFIDGCVSGVGRSKRSPCNPLRDRFNRFKGKTFDAIRKVFRDSKFIEHNSNSFRCPITGALYVLYNGGVYNEDTEFDHVELTHEDWPGFKVKFPLGENLTQSQRGIQLYQTSNNKEVPVTSLAEKIKGVNMLDQAMNKYLDKVVEDRATGVNVVETAVKLIENSRVFPDDKGILKRIAYVESKFGADTNTFRKGYHGGIWQIDAGKDGAFTEITKNYKAHDSPNQKILPALKQKFNFDFTKTEYEQLRKPLISALFARMRLSIVSEAIPEYSDVACQANYWKKHYNTSAGKGTEWKKDIDDFAQVSTVLINYVL